MSAPGMDYVSGAVASEMIDAASASTTPNWLELSLPVRALVDPPDANAAEATLRP